MRNARFILHCIVYVTQIARQIAKVTQYQSVDVTHAYTEVTRGSSFTQSHVVTKSCNHDSAREKEKHSALF